MVEFEFCKKCKNRRVSRSEGILCGLTNEKPNFGLDDCPDFVEDEVQAKRVNRHNKSYSDREVHKETIIRTIVSCLPIIGIGWLLVIFPVPVFVGIIGLILILVGAIGFLYAFIKFILLFQNYPDKENPDSNKSNKDLEVY